MADLEETPTWGPVYQLERTDKIDAGANGNGVANRQARELANRDAYLKQELENETTERQAADAAEVVARNGAIFTAIHEEVTQRDYAISSAVTVAMNAEVLAREAAIASAVTGEATTRAGAISALETALVQLVRYSVDPAENGLRLSTWLDEPIAPEGSYDNLRLVPYRSAAISLHDGVGWQRCFAALDPLMLSGRTTAGKIYDVFAYLNGASVKLELGPAWLNNTERSLALARQDGVLVASSSPTRRYLGTVFCEYAGYVQNQINSRHLWNAYNQVPVRLHVTDTTSSWNWQTAAWRVVRGSTANRVTLVCGQSAWLEAEAAWSAVNTAKAVPAAGIGIDKTNASDALVAVGAVPVASALTGGFGTAHLKGQLIPGYREVNWLEYGASGTSFEGWAAHRAVGLQAVIHA